MHRHIAVAALPGVVRAVYHVQYMGVQQVQCDERDRQDAGPQCAAIGIFCHAAQPHTPAQQHAAQNACGCSRQQNGGQREAQRQRKHCRQHRQQRHAEPAAQRQNNGSAPIRHRPAGQEQANVYE